MAEILAAFLGQALIGFFCEIWSIFWDLFGYRLHIQIRGKHSSLILQTRFIHANRDLSMRKELLGRKLEEITMAFREQVFIVVRCASINRWWLRSSEGIFGFLPLTTLGKCSDLLCWWVWCESPRSLRAWSGWKMSGAELQSEKSPLFCGFVMALGKNKHTQCKVCLQQSSLV